MTMTIDWEYPQWDNASKVHDWLNYATSELKDHWHDMPDKTKKIVAACLQEIANSEEWE